MASNNSLIKRVLIAQVGITCLFALAMISQGMMAAMSALLGGLICVLPNLYMARKLTAKRSADPSQLMSAFYAAEFGKIFITMALFALVFITMEWIRPLMLLVGFSLAQIAQWLVPLLMPNSRNNRE